MQLWMVSWKPLKDEEKSDRPENGQKRSKADQNCVQIVKFDTDSLPPILNALTTENAGQNLVLEVAVS